MIAKMENVAMNLGRVYHVNINVSNLDRSVEFYKRLGFEVVMTFDTSDEKTLQNICGAFGETPNAFRAAFMRLGNKPGAAIIDLVQWITRPTKGKPVQEFNHAGLFRVSFHVDNPDEVLADLEANHIPLLGPVGYGDVEGREARIFAFRDPDGTVLEVLSGME